jgi:hypothetical protein
MTIAKVLHPFGLLLLLVSCATLPPQSLSPFSVPPPLQKISLADVELVSFRLDYSNRPDTWLKVNPFPLGQPQVLAQELFEAWSSRFTLLSPLFPAEPNFFPDPGSFIEIMPHDSTAVIPGENPRSRFKATAPATKSHGLYLLVRLEEDQDAFGQIYQELEVVIALVNAQGTKVAGESFRQSMGRDITDGFIPALLPIEGKIADWLALVFIEAQSESPHLGRPEYQYRDHRRD